MVTGGSWSANGKSYADVEPGQVWQDIEGRYRVVVDVDPASRVASFGDGFHNYVESVMSCMRLVGFELGDGRRVMVADRFIREGSDPREVWVVKTVMPGASVSMKKVGVVSYIPAVSVVRLLDSGEFRRVAYAGSAVIHNVEIGILNNGGPEQIARGLEKIFGKQVQSNSKQEARAITAHLEHAAALQKGTPYIPGPESGQSDDERSALVSHDVPNGHRVAVTREQYEHADVVFCQNCGLRVKDRKRAVREGACDPIRLGDLFRENRAGRIGFVEWKAIRPYGMRWLVRDSQESEILLLPSDLAGDVEGTLWTRMPRHGKAMASAFAAQELFARASSLSEETYPTQVDATFRNGYPDRSEIDAILREDARLHPEFAAARKAAVLAYVENVELMWQCDTSYNLRSLLYDVRRVLHNCVDYERARGGVRTPDRITSEIVEDMSRSGAHFERLVAASLLSYETARSRT